MAYVKIYFLSAYFKLNKQNVSFYKGTKKGCQFQSEW